MIVFAYQCGKPNFVIASAMRNKTLFQTFNESAIAQVAARFRALVEASRLKLIFAAG